MTAPMTRLADWLRLLEGTAAAAILIAGCIGAGSALADRAAVFAPDGMRSLDERLRLRCPPQDAQGPFVAPAAIDPSPEMALWVSYTAGDDLVRVTGEDTMEAVDLGDGDDIALLYDVGPEFSAQGGAGADTVILCSMAGLTASITLGSWGGRDTDRDIVIIDRKVFDAVPHGLWRVIRVFEFDLEHDRLVIHAPQELLSARRMSRELGGLRIGSVLIQLYSASYGPDLRYDGHEQGALLFNVTPR
ncbi:MAG TPA: hypothetical protein PL143_00950 [Rhodocyclaceae bacterium]|nr:hypothetical protein [Rhodocyclaceae bacterium]